MHDRRLFWNSVLLSLPALVLVIGGAVFLMAALPDLKAQERARVTGVYREQAVAAKEADAGEEFSFKESGLKRGDLRIAKEPWGYAEKEVWYLKGETARRLKVPRVETTNVAAALFLLWAVFSVAVLVLTGYTVFRAIRFVRERDDFVAATIHDLTTPLVGLRGTIGEDDEEARNLNERMLRLVENLRAFLRLGGRRRKPASAPFDLVAACREAYRTFAADYRDLLGCEVALRMGEGTEDGLYVRADETMTVQILWNLYANDLKYAAPYGPVEVRFAVRGAFAEAVFADEGPGMTPGERRRAFDRYYRARTIKASGKGGFGIGLATSREFARAMGGDLTVEPNEPQGCRFILRLPLQLKL